MNLERTRNAMPARWGRWIRRACLGAGATLALLTASVQAQDYPSRPIRLVVPFAAGGVTDAAARSMASEMSKQLGQPVVVDNRAGAGGVIGADVVAKSPPDGYTLCFCSNGVFLIQPYLMAKMPMNPLTDLQPVTHVYDADLVLSVNPASPFNSVEDVLKQAKTKKGGVSYASVGVGSIHHLSMERLAKQTGGTFVHVPYKGDAPAITDLLGGQIDLALLSTQAATSLSKEGKVRLLAASGNSRAPGLPDVPTFSESGVPGFSFSVWIGLFVPTGTPAPVVQRLHDVASKVIQTPQMKTWMASQGLRPNGGSGSEMKTFIADQSKQFGALIRELDIKTE